MNVHAVDDFKWPGLTRPDGERISMNDKDFVAIDRDRDATFDAIYRPQALYNLASEGLHANNGAVLLQEVATNLPIYREDTGPTDFHLHLPPGGIQFVLVTLLPKSTSGMATADDFAKGEVAVCRVIRGTAEFKDSAGKVIELARGDTVTAGKNSLNLVGIGENTQILRLGADAGHQQSVQVVADAAG